MIKQITMIIKTKLLYLCLTSMNSRDVRQTQSLQVIVIMLRMLNQEDEFKWRLVYVALRRNTG